MGDEEMGVPPQVLFVLINRTWNLSKKEISGKTECALFAALFFDK
jgi:hypothetical protein